MLNLKVTTSRDPNAIGEYDFHFDVISIGRDLKNDIIFEDTSIHKFHALIYIENDLVFLQTLGKNQFCFHNGVKFSGTRNIKKHDTMTIGHSEITLVQFQSTMAAIDFTTLYENFLKNHPEQSHILETLDLRLQELELERSNTEKNHGK